MRKLTSVDGIVYELRLLLRQAPETDHNADGDQLIFTFSTIEAADTVLHVLEGYCSLARNGAGSSEAGKEELPLLPTGCPFRLVSLGRDVEDELYFSQNSINKNKKLCRRAAVVVLSVSYSRRSVANANTMNAAASH